MASVIIRGGELTATIGDNAAGPAGVHSERYNGIWSLVSKHQPRSPFVPTYAGFNLEHIFDGSARVANGDHRFEPRLVPMSVEQIDESTARLHQPPTPVTKLESWITFKIVPEDKIDITFKILPHEKTWVRDTFGVFFASYIDEPLNKSLYVTTPQDGEPPRRWHQFCTPAHDVLSTMVHYQDDVDLTFDTDHLTLYKAFSPVKFDLPLMFGIVRDMALAFMINQTHGIRFSHSPSGGGPWRDRSDTCSAWDLQFLVPHAEVGKTSEWKIRVLYRPFKDRDDILNAYKEFNAGLQQGM